MIFVKGQPYAWADIVSGTYSSAGPPYYLLHRQGTKLVTAACLDIAQNPRAPYEILPAKRHPIPHWADNLLAQTEPIQMFVKELDGQWYCRGTFKVMGSTADPNELKLRGLQANRIDDIYKIIFLTEQTA